MKTLPDLTNQELFDLVRLLSNEPEKNTLPFLVCVASELRQRKLTVTEDYVIHLAAAFAC